MSIEITVSAPRTPLEVSLADIVGPYLNVELDEDDVIQAMAQMDDDTILAEIDTESLVSYTAENIEAVYVAQYFPHQYIIDMFNTLPDMVKLAATNCLPTEPEAFTLLNAVQRELVSGTSCAVTLRPALDLLASNPLVRRLMQDAVNNALTAKKGA